MDFQGPDHPDVVKARQRLLHVYHEYIIADLEAVTLVTTSRILASHPDCDHALLVDMVGDVLNLMQRRDAAQAALRIARDEYIATVSRVCHEEAHGVSR